MPKSYGIAYFYEACLQAPKTAAVRIQSFPSNHCIHAFLTGFAAPEKESCEKQSENLQLFTEIVSEYH